MWIVWRGWWNNDDCVGDFCKEDGCELNCRSVKIGQRRLLKLVESESWREDARWLGEDERRESGLTCGNHTQ